MYKFLKLFIFISLFCCNLKSYSDEGIVYDSIDCKNGYCIVCKQHIAKISTEKDKYGLYKNTATNELSVLLPLEYGRISETKNPDQYLIKRFSTKYDKNRRGFVRIFGLYSAKDNRFLLPCKYEVINFDKYDSNYIYVRKKEKWAVFKYDSLNNKYVQLTKFKYDYVKVENGEIKGGKYPFKMPDGEWFLNHTIMRLFKA